MNIGPIRYNQLSQLENVRGRKKLTQMKPVAVKAKFWFKDNFSAGRERSLTPAATSAHLAKGAQKKIVLYHIS